MHPFWSVILMVVFASLPACSKPVTDSETNYAVLTNAQQSSLLVSIDQTNTISVCILERIPTVMRNTGVSQADITNRLNEVRQDTESSFKTWLSFLSLNKFWRRNNVTFNFYLGSQECKNPPANVVTIITDVGPPANPSVKCGNGFYLPEPDGRLCRAHAFPSRRRIHLSSAGWHGGTRVIAHEVGHILGLGDVYDEAGYQEGIEGMNENAIMGRSSYFHVDDVLGINGVWSYIKFGVVCGRKTEMNPDVKSTVGVLHCAAKENRSVRIDAVGKTSCESGYKLSPAQVCVADFSQFPAVVPSCPANAPDYDAMTGVCCPKGQRFFHGTMTCVEPSVIQNALGNRNFVAPQNPSAR